MKPNAGALTLMAGLLLGLVGCSTPQTSSLAELQGKWTGREPSVDPATPRLLTIAGKHIAYQGAIATDWGNGTFVLQKNTQPKRLLISLTECGMPQYAGKTCLMIYEVKDGQLEVAANEPGNPAGPVDFHAPGARHMIFTKE